MNQRVWPEQYEDEHPVQDRDDWTSEQEDYDVIMEERQLDRRWRRIGESE